MDYETYVVDHPPPSSRSAVGKRKNRLPHICFVAPRAFPLLAGDERIQVIGGSELQQVIVARGLAKRGYPVSMICLNFGQEDKVEIDGITVFRAFRPSEGVPVLRFVWPRLTSIWSCLKRADADIYYHRSASMLTGVVAAFCERKRKKSIFAVASNSDLVRNEMLIRYKRDRWIYEYGLRHIERILVQNLEQARLCLETFGRETTLVPNCPQAVTLPSSQSPQEVLWVSTIRQLKRPDLFLDVAQALPRYRFRIVGGPANDELRLFESIRARAASLSNVTFTGFVPYSRIDEHFDNAALFLNTSETEGFPNTFLQAWTRGVPTISFVDCGARVEGKALGRTVASPEDMIAAVASLMTDETNRSQEGATCREYVERNHSTDRILDLYEQVFCDLLRARTRADPSSL